MSNPVVLIKLTTGEYIKINRDDILFIAHGSDDGKLHINNIIFDNNSLTTINIDHFPYQDEKI